MGIPVNKPVSWELFGFVAELRIIFSTAENRRLVSKNGALEDDIPFQGVIFHVFHEVFFLQIFKNGCNHSPLPLG